MSDNGSQSFLTAIRFLVKVTVTVTIEPAVMLLLSSSSRTAKTGRENNIYRLIAKCLTKTSTESEQFHNAFVVIIYNLTN